MNDLCQTPRCGHEVVDHTSSRFKCEVPECRCWHFDLGPLVVYVTTGGTEDGRR